jgi:hypothetical protein
MNKSNSKKNEKVSSGAPKKVVQSKVSLDVHDLHL